MSRAGLPVKTQGASVEGRDIESQPENRSRRLLTVDLGLVASAATRLDQSRTIVSLCLPKSMQSVGLLTTSDRNMSYKDKFTLIHIHRVSFHGHAP